MRRGIWTIAFVLLLVQVESGAGPALQPAHAQGRVSAPSSQLADANNRFGFALLHRLIDSQPGHNVFLSPVSATLALGMTFDGARESTASAMAQAMQLDGMSQTSVRLAARVLLASLRSADPHVQLDLADSLWMRQGVPFRASF